MKELDKPSWSPYAHMENQLTYNAEIKKKQMTEEMMGKLKEVGNSVLGLFGMSIDNFNAVQNENGGYSIQFQK